MSSDILGSNHENVQESGFGKTRRNLNTTKLSHHDRLRQPIPKLEDPDSPITQPTDRSGRRRHPMLPPSLPARDHLSVPSDQQLLGSPRAQSNAGMDIPPTRLGNTGTLRDPPENKGRTRSSNAAGVNFNTGSDSAKRRKTNDHTASPSFQNPIQAQDTEAGELESTTSEEQHSGGGAAMLTRDFIVSLCIILLNQN